MGWYNDNLAGYNYNPNAKGTVANTGNPFGGGFNQAQAPKQTQATGLQYNPLQYSANDNKNALSYKTNVGGKDYFYSPQSVSLGGGANYGWDKNKALGLGGVEWNRAMGGATANPNNGNPFSQQANPTYESGYLFENDPNAKSNMGYNEWKDSSWWKDQGLGLAAIAAAPFVVPGAAGSAASGAGGTAAGGSGVATAPAAGGNSFANAFAASGANPVAVGGSQGAAGLQMGGGGLGLQAPANIGSVLSGGGTGGMGLVAPANGASIMGAGSAAGGLGSLWQGWKDMTGLTGAQTGQLGLGLGDLAMRLNQQGQLEDLMNSASDRADPLKQPERKPYQDLLSQYMNGGMDITQQPAIKAELDYAMRAAQAQMAKAGITGAGNVGMATADYANEAMQKSALPYLQYLSGLGGFNQGVGNSGQIMATLGGQASGAPFQGMNSLGQAINNLTYDSPPWWSSAYNAQQQMMGRGSNSNIYGIS